MGKGAGGDGVFVEGESTPQVCEGKRLGGVGEGAGGCEEGPIYVVVGTDLKGRNAFKLSA